MTIKFVICVSTLLVFFDTPSFAASLPSGSKDLSEEQITALYSGNTMQWDKDNRAFFAPDGSVVSTFSFKGSQGYTVGSWKVTGNEICKNTAEWFDVTTGKSGKGTPDCWRWAIKGKKYYTTWSVRFDGSTQKELSWSSGENKKIKNGDLVSKAVETMKAPK